MKKLKIKNFNMILIEQRQNIRIIPRFNNKYKCSIGQEILPLQQRKCSYIPLAKSFEKQVKTNEKQEEKQRVAIEEHEEK